MHRIGCIGVSYATGYRLHDESAYFVSDLVVVLNIHENIRHSFFFLWTFRETSHINFDKKSNFFLFIIDILHKQNNF